MPTTAKLRSTGTAADAPIAYASAILRKSAEPHRIVIVGGGAGGLELATSLGNKFARDKRIDIVLIDRSATHLWKPLLHEVAAGSLDANAHQIEYVAQARWHHFTFHQGELRSLDRDRKAIGLDAVLDEEGVEILPPREIAYGTLVLAIGSVTNFFGVPGASEHAIAVDTVKQAEHFRRRLIAACVRAQNLPHDASGDTKAEVNIVIIGGGATGVELSAELRNTAETLRAYGLHQLDPYRDVRITIIDSGPRILGPLPDRVAEETAKMLGNLRIDILPSEKVISVEEDAVRTASGKRLPSDVTVWAAGIRIAPVLAELSLPVNKLGQLNVLQTLQTEADPDIFAFGDCASCPWPEKQSTVPPRAQAAHQQAKFLFHTLQRRIAGKPLPQFHFHDRGSLVSLGHYNAVGNLTGKLTGRSVLVEGMLARWLYASLYRMHQVTLHGIVHMLLNTLAEWLRGKTAPRVKLH